MHRVHRSDSLGNRVFYEVDISAAACRHKLIMLSHAVPPLSLAGSGKVSNFSACVTRVSRYVRFVDLPLSPLDNPKNLRSASISPTRHSQFKSQKENFDDDSRGPTAISLLQVGPPNRRGHPSSIEKRYALLPISCADLSIHLRVTKPTLNSITRAPTSFLPTGATHCQWRSHAPAIYV